MKNLKDLVIRTAQVGSSRYGFIYACDPEREKREEPHTYIFGWDNNEIELVESDYDAHSLCVMEHPKAGLVNISEEGWYTANFTDGRGICEDLFTHTTPPPKTRRVRGLRSVRAIDGWAHAIGIRGMAYRLDKPNLWTRIDDGLPDTFNGQAIHGFGLSNLFAVGRAGQIWHFNGKEWQQENTPTNRNMYAVVCAPDGTVYVGGNSGMLLRGGPGQWSIIEQAETGSDIWDLDWFADKLYVSTLNGLFTLENDRLQPVNYGKHTVSSTYQLSVRKGVMWSNGEREIMEFDGETWTRIV